MVAISALSPIIALVTFIHLSLHASLYPSAAAPCWCWCWCWLPPPPPPPGPRFCRAGEPRSSLPDPQAPVPPLLPPPRGVLPFALPRGESLEENPPLDPPPMLFLLWVRIGRGTDAMAARRAGRGGKESGEAPRLDLPPGRSRPSGCGCVEGRRGKREYIIQSSTPDRGIHALCREVGYALCGYGAPPTGFRLRLRDEELGRKVEREWHRWVCGERGAFFWLRRCFPGLRCRRGQRRGSPVAGISIGIRIRLRIMFPSEAAEWERRTRQLKDSPALVLRGARRPMTSTWDRERRVREL